jgi:hypothetical protein
MSAPVWAQLPGCAYDINSVYRSCSSNRTPPYHGRKLLAFWHGSAHGDNDRPLLAAPHNLPTGRRGERPSRDEDPGSCSFGPRNSLESRVRDLDQWPPSLGEIRAHIRDSRLRQDCGARLRPHQAADGVQVQGRPSLEHRPRSVRDLEALEDLARGESRPIPFSDIKGLPWGYSFPLLLNST